ncbi:MAG: hypothetical protein AAFQ82_19665 [Myxococcota bacterium]
MIRNRSALCWALVGCLPLSACWCGSDGPPRPPEASSLDSVNQSDGPSVAPIGQGAERPYLEDTP